MDERKILLVVTLFYKAKELNLIDGYIAAEIGTHPYSYEELLGSKINLLEVTSILVPLCPYSSEEDIGMLSLLIFRLYLREVNCNHIDCKECNGFGRKKDGTICDIFVDCKCNRCTPTFHWN